MSIIVQQDATIYIFIIFLLTALHVSDDTLIHHQVHTQTVIISGTDRTVFATVRCRGGVTMHGPMSIKNLTELPEVEIRLDRQGWFVCIIFSGECN